MKVLITGGASGLGESITRRIASESKNTVYFTYHKSEDNARRLEADHSNAFSIKCDFKNDLEVQTLKTKLAELDIDVLINNAYTGGFIKSHFQKTDPADFLEDFKENIMPVVILTQSAISVFRKKKSGKIITILTSALINTPPIGTAVYTANKAYLMQLTKTWATENAKYNITSNSVSPSFMRTNFTSGIDDRLIEQIEEKHPFNKLLTVNEVSDSVFFLLNASQQVNGFNLIINAGSDVI